MNKLTHTPDQSSRILFGRRQKQQGDVSSVENEKRKTRKIPGVIIGLTAGSVVNALRKPKFWLAIIGLTFIIAMLGLSL